jgi:hypothetical protein
MPRCITAFLLTPLLLLACSNPFGPTVTRLYTDSPEYTLTKTSFGYGGNVTLSFSNANDFAVSIPEYCSGAWAASLELRRPSDGVWVYAKWLGDGTKCGSLRTVPAGATIRRVVALGFPDPSFAGDYRVVMDTKTYGGAPELFTSNTFTLLPSAP